MTSGFPRETASLLLQPTCCKGVEGVTLQHSLLLQLCCRGLLFRRQSREEALLFSTLFLPPHFLFSSFPKVAQNHVCAFHQQQRHTYFYNNSLTWHLQFCSWKHFCAKTLSFNLQSNRQIAWKPHPHRYMHCKPCTTCNHAEFCSQADRILHSPTALLCSLSWQANSKAARIFQQ